MASIKERVELFIQNGTLKIRPRGTESTSLNLDFRVFNGKMEITSSKSVAVKKATLATEPDICQVSSGFQFSVKARGNVVAQNNTSAAKKLVLRFSDHTVVETLIEIAPKGTFNIGIVADEKK